MSISNGAPHTHDEFEGTSEQIRAHLVVWIGVLLVFTVTASAVRQGIAAFGFRLALAGSALYIPVAVWHFIEHANGNDPEFAHALIALAGVAIIAGARWRRSLPDGGRSSLDLFLVRTPIVCRPALATCPPPEPSGNVG